MYFFFFGSLIEKNISLNGDKSLFLVRRACNDQTNNENDLFYDIETLYAWSWMLAFAMNDAIKLCTANSLAEVL